MSEQKRPWIGRLFGNKWATWPFILAFVALFLLAFGTMRRAESAEYLAFNGGTSIIHASAPTIGAGVGWDGPRDTNIECGLQLVGSGIYKNRDIRNQMAGQCMLVDGLGKFDFGLGLAYLQNIDPLNGSNLNFALEARYNFSPHLYAGLRHWSNAGTTAGNTGQNLLVLGWKWL